MLVKQSMTPTHRPAITARHVNCGTSSPGTVGPPVFNPPAMLYPETPSRPVLDFPVLRERERLASMLLVDSRVGRPLILIGRR